MEPLDSEHFRAANGFILCTEKWKITQQGFNSAAIADMRLF
jgi:hypothetical protein